MYEAIADIRFGYGSTSRKVRCSNSGDEIALRVEGMDTIRHADCILIPCDHCDISGFSASWQDTAFGDFHIKRMHWACHCPIHSSSALPFPLHRWFLLSLLFFLFAFLHSSMFFLKKYKFWIETALQGSLRTATHAFYGFFDSSCGCFCWN